MSNKNKFTEDNIQTLVWQEHIRKRPGMYIGQINIKGFVEMLKGIISYTIHSTESNSFVFVSKNDTEAKLIFNNLKQKIDNNWKEYKHNPSNPFLLELSVLNVLSKKFKIRFWDSSNNKLGEEYYEEGKLKNGQQQNSIECTKVEIDFMLDETIWGSSFSWNYTYITHQLREFAYLNKNTKFTIEYMDHEEACKIVYHFKKGLKDRIDIEVLNGLGACYFETHVEKTFEDFKIEASFAFRDYSVDPTYLKSYANDYFTFENGSHVDGLLKGVTNGVMRYFQKHNLTEKYKISERGMKESLVAAINIRMLAPVFSGCVKNKLANPEIIEPIASYISDMLFQKIESDPESTKRLIRKFEI